MASAAKPSGLTYRDLAQFYPPGTPMIMKPSQEKVVLGTHLGDIWFDAKIPSMNGNFSLRTDSLAPILSEGMLVLIRSKTGQQGYKIARVTSVDQGGDVELKILYERTHVNKQ